MLRKCWITGSLLLLMAWPSIAQLQEPDPLIAAASTRGDAHFEKEEAAWYARIRTDAYMYDTLLPQLIALEKKNNNSFLRVHILRRQAYEITFYKKFTPGVVQPEALGLMEQAIRLCYKLKDESLLAETYYDLAELFNSHNKHEEYLITLTKAIETGRRTNVRLFSDRHEFFKMVGMCKAAYLMYSYRESIAYGYNALQIRSNMKLPPGIPDPGFLPDIYLYDLIGAGYKKLGAADSSIYFYHQLLAQLNKVDADSQTVELWTAIANGNIGENLVAKQEYDKAFPLLQQWLDMATKYGDNNNICLAKQALAQYYAGKKDHIHAITLWKDVFSFGRSNSNYDYAKKGAEGIYFSYRVTGPADSAFYYADQLLMYRDSFTNRINQSGLQAIQTKIRFENLQYSLETTTASLKQEKRSRNLILAGIAMLAVIAILSYSRQQLKAKNKLQWTAQRQKEAESEARQAKKQIESFVSHIMEKNELIDQLKEKITTDEALQARQDINESLSSYTLISDEEWEKFRADFSRAYPLFLSILANHLPQITPAEERMSTLIFLRFSNQQIANTLGIGKESVTRAKHRLRQRLQLTKEDSLENYICNILKDNNL